MVIILNGPLGVGKTETGWRILKLASRGALVDIDYAAAVSALDVHASRDQAYAYDAATVLAKHHFGHGCDCIVVTWVFETSSQLASIRERLRSLGPIHTYRLMCSAAELERRIRCRANDELEREVRRGRELLAIFDVVSPPDQLGAIIDTEKQSIDEVAAEVAARAGLATNRPAAS